MTTKAITIHPYYVNLNMGASDRFVFTRPKPKVNPLVKYCDCDEWSARLYKPVCRKSKLHLNKKQVVETTRGFT